MRAFRLVLLVSGLIAGSAAAAERWQLQYFHDEDDSRLTIAELQFTGPQRGMAVGFYTSGESKPKPAGLVTSDGGKTWSPVRLPGLPESLFLLNDRIGWLVTRGRVWRTTEFGRDWMPLAKLRDVSRVYFLDENRGFAIGPRKSAYQTSDGGQHWTKLAQADEPTTTRDYTVYQCIEFSGPKFGLISGWSKAPQRDRRRARLPDWMALEERPRELPGMGVMLETVDGGANWKPSQASMFGRITRIRLRPDGVGLGLIEFFDAFEWPSEVMLINWRSGKSSRVFREKNRAVTDMALPPGGPAYLAAIEPPGSLARSPVPGKLKILRSRDMVNWTEMQVDYRAVATRAVFAAPEPGHLWVATDSGMILKLVSE
jgi:hypothetical protein